MNIARRAATITGFYECLPIKSNGGILEESKAARMSEYTGGNAPSRTESLLVGLTERERQVVCLVGRGLSNKEVGRQMNISEGTIKVHLHRVYQKLAIRNRTALAVLAAKEDLAAPGPFHVAAEGTSNTVILDELT